MILLISYLIDKRIYDIRFINYCDRVIVKMNGINHNRLNHATVLGIPYLRSCTNVFSPPPQNPSCTLLMMALASQNAKLP